MDESHVKDVLEIWRDRMGRQYPDESKVYNAIEENNEKYIGWVTVNNSEIIGFSIGKILTREEAEETVPSMDLFNENVNLVGLFDLNVVKKSIEGYGVGTQQIKCREKYFRDNGITHMFAICWIRDEHPDSMRLLEKEGFNCINEIPNFWYNETLKRNAECIDCGNPCTCTAGIYRKIIK